MRRLHAAPNSPGDGALLSVHDATVVFGGNRAVDRVSVQVREGARVAVIGPNGAGKSTLMGAIAGNVRLHAGAVRFRGQGLDGMSVYHRARLGIARSFQNLALFESMTVRENLEVGFEGIRGSKSPKVKRDAVNRITTLFNLEAYEQRRVETLSYGTKKLVELGRCLVSEPTLLILDEPAAGLDTAEKSELAGALLRAAGDSGVAVLLVEHDMTTVEALADEVYVLDAGSVIANGSFLEVTSNADVVRAYLGQ